LDRPDSASPSDAEREIIREEESLAVSIRAAIQHADRRDREREARRSMTSLRSDLGEARQDDVASIAAEAQRVRSTSTIRERLALPDFDEPYFAHMKLESERGVRDVLLGQHTFIDSSRGVTIVDWREAPIAQVFFHHEEGDDYEQDLPDRSLEGVVLKRRILAFDGGELVHIQAPDCALRRDADGEWTRDSPVDRPTLEGGEGGALAKRMIGTGLSGRKLPVISSLLDEMQYEALTHDVEHPLLILGGAGCGKTTVALHRLAYLVYQDSQLYRPDRLVVIVPEEGLVRLTKTLLDELGMSGVRVTTIDEWFIEVGRSRFPDLPTKLSVSTPASVVRLKRHPAFCARLAQVALGAGLGCAVELDRLLGVDAEIRELYEGSDEAFPEIRLRSAIRTVSERWPGKVEGRHDEIEVAMARFGNPDLDRERLFGDRVLIEEIVAAANGDLPESTIDRAIAWYRLQRSETAEEAYAHVAKARRTAVDGRSLDAGTPGEDADSIDVEDYALLLELERSKTGRSLAARGSFQAYAHMILDEAQELSEVECRVFGEAVSTDGCVTVAGDPAQQIGGHSDFRGWDTLMQALGQGRAAPITLETSYRCTRPILEFGQAVLGPLAPPESPRATREGAPVSRSHLSTELHASLVLAEALSDLFDREPMAQVAIISREDETAERLHDALAQQLPVRLVLDGRFSFRPGIDVTSVQQVKGLEFDYVVIPDATRVDYPSDSSSRRMLHVAATRAIHQLWILSTGDWSDLVRARIEEPAS
jgi:DNA helicase-2/ATP-dependent DNA helicase PcrA